jgi:hypothetical protein
MSTARHVLRRSGVPGFMKLHVDVQDRRATLFGTLSTDFERDVAVHLVRRVNGLDGVESEIAVVPRQRADQTARHESPAGRGWRTRLIGAAILATLLAVVFWSCW